MAKAGANPLRQLVRSALAMLLPRSMFVVSERPSCKQIFLTFDDGPDPRWTPGLLDVLKAQNVRATFFVVGERAQKHPELVGRIIAEGHAIGNHTFTESDPYATSTHRFLREIPQTERLLTDLTGFVPRIVRPPMGKLTLGKFFGLLISGHTIVLWSLDPRDYSAASTNVVSDYFKHQEITAGDIILMHDNQPHAADVVGELSELIHSRGLSWGIPKGWIPGKFGHIQNDAGRVQL